MTTLNDELALQWAVENLDKWPTKPSQMYSLGVHDDDPFGIPKHYIRLNFCQVDRNIVYKDDWYARRMDSAITMLFPKNHEEGFAIAQRLLSQTVSSFLGLQDEDLDSEKPRSKYHVKINGHWCDVYDVLTAFGVTNPADQHAIKKMLMPGHRGGKTATQDREEAIASLLRAIELEKARESSL